MSLKEKSPAPTILELERAALGEVPPERLKEIKSHLRDKHHQQDTLETLVQQNEAFHQQHPNLLKVIVRQRQKSASTPPRTIRLKKLALIACGLCGILLLFLLISTSQQQPTGPQPSARRDVSNTLQRPINTATETCDTTITYALNSDTKTVTHTIDYVQHMSRCVEIARRALSIDTSLISPGKEGSVELRYACQQHWGVACYDLGRFWTGGYAAFNPNNRIIRQQDQRPLQDRLFASHYFERGCALGHEASCCQLSNNLNTDPTLRRIARLNPDHFAQRAHVLKPSWCVHKERASLPTITLTKDRQRLVVEHAKNNQKTIVAIPKLRTIQNTSCPIFELDERPKIDQQDVNGDGLLDVIIWSDVVRCFIVLRRAQTTDFSIESQHTYSLTCLISGEAITWPCWGLDLANSKTKVMLRHGNVTKHHVIQILDEPSFAAAGSLSFKDINFDGHIDLFVPASPGCAGNCLHSIWLFDIKTRRFVPHAALKSLSNVKIIDPKRKLWSTTTCLGGACSSFEAQLYKVDNQTFKQIAHAKRTEKTNADELQYEMRVYRTGDHSPACHITTGVNKPTPEQMANCPYKWTP